MSGPTSNRDIPARLVGPLLTAFLASGVIMVVELAAGRLISRHLGMSLYTWTSIIAAVMTGMAIGNAFGGHLADRYAPKRLLAVLFAAAALLCAAIPAANDLLGTTTALQALAWPARIFLHCAALFLVPALALGAISPVVARLALATGARSGSTIGLVYAACVAGSIFFTFLTGYQLVSLLPISGLFHFVGIALGLLALAYLAAAFLTQDAPPARATPDHQTTAQAFPWWTAILTVLLSNFAFMAIELGAARILSRDYGSSIYTWTAVIGVLLTGISLGNALGGFAADRGAGRAVVAKYFLAASIATLAAPLLFRLVHEAFLHDPRFASFEWSTRIVATLAAGFFLPSLFLGYLSPLMVKRGLDAGRAPGRTVASVYAWGAVGGVGGTLATGYWLIDWFGATAVVCAAASLLAIGAFAYAYRNPIYIAWTLIILAALYCALGQSGSAIAIGDALCLRAKTYPGTIYQDESQYSYIAVRAATDNPRMRTIVLDKLEHSKVDLDHPGTFKQEYEWVYEAILEQIFPTPQPLRSFFIGGGGFIFPRYFDATRPDSHTEVAEIDPAVTKAAYDAFGLPPDNHLEIHNMDARNRVESLIAQRREDPAAVPPYHLIVGDSFNDFSVPAHLTTLEFTREVNDLLSDDGLYLINLIDMYDPGSFLAAFLNTLKQVFPEVRLFNCGAPPNVRDTFVVVCAKHPLDLRNVAGQARFRYGYPGVEVTPAAIDQLIERNGHQILSDDYAPTELLLLPVLRRPLHDSGQEHYPIAVEALQHGDTDTALKECLTALEVHPTWSLVLELSGDLLLQRQKTNEAIDLYREALRNSTDPAALNDKLGTALLNAGIEDAGTQALETAAKLGPDRVDTLLKLSAVLLETSHIDRAIALLTRVTEVDPKNVIAYYNLGFAHAANLDYAKAAAQWEAALNIDPTHTDSLDNLLLAYINLKDFDNAFKVVARYRALKKYPPASSMEQLKVLSGRSE